MTEIEIRFPSANERSLMEGLYNEMYEVIGSSPPPGEWVTNVYEQSQLGDRTYWLALVDSELIGFTDFKITPFHPGSQQKFARIHDLFVKPSVQRCGYGTQLARKVIRSAIEQGATSIELNVLPDNQIALKFWQSLGFNLHLYVLQMST